LSLNELVVVLSPTIGYISQINLIRKDKTTGNFSLDVCAILIFANILRICFWFIFFYMFFFYFLTNIKVRRKFCNFLVASINDNDLYTSKFFVEQKIARKYSILKK